LIITFLPPLLKNLQHYFIHIEGMNSLVDLMAVQLSAIQLYLDGYAKESFVNTNVSGKLGDSANPAVPARNELTKTK